VRVRYARALLANGEERDLLRAREVLTEAVGLRPSDELALYLLAQVQRRTGDAESAEATSRQLIAMNENIPRGYASLAEALETRRRFASVVVELEPAVSRFRRQDDSAVALAVLLPHLGFAYQQTGRFRDAVSIFEEALALSPGDASLTAYLVQSHLGLGEYTRAIELARASRSEHPDDLDLARLEASALSASGQGDEAIGLLDAFLQSQGDNPEAHVALARAYDDAGRGDQAIDVLESAEVRFPSLLGITFELGAAFERQSRYAEAEEAFRRVIASDPEYTPALNYLGYMFAEQGERLSESVDLIKRALAIEPDNGSYLDSLGWAYFKDGQFDLAEQYLRRAAEQMTTNSVVQNHFGDALFELGRVQEAIEVWNRALKGDRDDIDPDEIDRKIRSAREGLQQR
jgi:tetratricopeptide (TPR) repeat protein